MDFIRFHKNASRKKAVAVSTMLVNILEVFQGQVTEVGLSVKSQNAEEIRGGCDLAILLCQIVFQEREESVIANTRAQGIKKMRAAKIDRVGIGAEPAAVIYWNIHPAFRLIKVNAQLLFHGNDRCRFHKNANRKKVVDVRTMAEPETMLK